MVSKTRHISCRRTITDIVDLCIIQNKRLKLQIHEIKLKRPPSNSDEVR